MKVTQNGIKYRQPRKEGYLQKVSAEQKEYVEAYAPSRITENNITNTGLSGSGLLEKILDKDNMNQAFKKVKSNKGAGGIDGMEVDELLQYLKENGKVRKLGIPTVVDRVMQQAIAQVLSPIFENQFSDNSFGFRPKRSAHDAIQRCQKNVDEGYKFVVDMDLEKYFDTVNQSKLVEVLSRTIKDGRVISLIK
jgi:retron-type reverse transcriptase